MRRATTLLTTLVLAAATVDAGAADPQPRFDRRWVWVMPNLLVEKEADRVVALVERAGRAGYNSVVISDYKLNLLARMPKTYSANVERVKQAARRAKVELIPAVFPIGYSN